MSTEKAKLRGNKARLENSWPLGAIPKEVINWIHKIKRNQINDNNHLSKLYSQGWRVLIVWECALASMENYDRIACWLKGDCSDRHPDQLPSVNSINTISKTEIG